MINVAEFTEQLRSVLKNAPTLDGFVKDVERAEYLNMDPARTPWVGVYRTEISYAPRALGQHSKSWEATITLKLVVQAHADTGPAAEDALEEVIHKVLTVLLTDLSVRSVVQTLNSLRVQYSYDETESQTMDFQWAFITLVYEARTGV